MVSATQLPADKPRGISMRKLILFVFMSVFLAACGQKGPLYLPQDAGTTDTEADADKQQRDQ